MDDIQDFDKNAELNHTEIWKVQFDLEGEFWQAHHAGDIERAKVLRHLIAKLIELATAHPDYNGEPAKDPFSHKWLDHDFQ